MNGDIADQIRDPACTMCLMGVDAERTCVTGSGPAPARVMVVGKMPFSRGLREELDGYLRDAGLDPTDIYFTSAIKCRNFEREPSNKDVKACRYYLEQELKLVRPRYILALGNEALLGLTGRSGITKHRGRAFKREQSVIIPTIAPGAVKRNPGQRSGFEADLRFFANKVKGRKTGLSKPDVAYVFNKEQLKGLMALLARAHEVAYDVETTGENEFAADAAIVSIAFTGEAITDGGAKKQFTAAVPLYHPESPWRGQWQRVLRLLGKHLKEIPKRDAHNGTYDDRWLVHFGVDVHKTFDTILAAHVLDENRPKGLKPLSQTLLGVEPWAIDTKDLLTTPIQEVLEYNALDTYYDFHLAKLFRKQLRREPRKNKIFRKILMPASWEYRDAERAGVWVDVERLMTRRKIAYDTLARIEEQLMEHVPPKEQWPTNAKGKFLEPNFNASNFARWLLFDYLGLPVLERGKDKDDGTVGNPSMREGVMLELRDHHPIIPLMIERVKWARYCTFYLDNYMEQLDDSDRLHTSYKLHGTVTGRTSSGKVDEEKVTARAAVKRKGLNMQQVPRDPFIRGILGTPAPYWQVSADFSQIELRIVAFLSRDKRMLLAYQNDEDIHLITASGVLSMPASQVTKEQRKKAKAVNFGFVYGMSWRKFIQTAFENYDLVVEPDEAMAVREAYFNLYTGLLPWHDKQRRLVNKFGRVESPLGRVRHLPDIYSPVKSIKAEAERQAINSPVQSFASDMTLLSMTLASRRLRDEGLDARVIGTVHDEINFEVHEKDLARAIVIIRDTMENLPLEEWFGVTVDVPIVADIEVGRWWGDCVELTRDQVDNFDLSMIPPEAGGKV